MNLIELGKKKLQLGKIRIAREEMELRVLIKQQELEQLAKDIDIQKEAENELSLEIESISKEG